MITVTSSNLNWPLPALQRMFQVGTLNYMSPEAIQGGSNNPLGGAPLKVRRQSDIWSLGCILYQVCAQLREYLFAFLVATCRCFPFSHFHSSLSTCWDLLSAIGPLGPTVPRCHCRCFVVVPASYLRGPMQGWHHDLTMSITFAIDAPQMIYGRTPFADLPFIPKMNAICNPNHIIQFTACKNPAAVDVMKRCLDRNPDTRITMQVRPGCCCSNCTDSLLLDGNACVGTSVSWIGNGLMAYLMAKPTECSQ